MDAAPEQRRLSPVRSQTRQGRARLLALDALDQRTAAAQAARRLVATLTDDLGGSDRLSRCSDRLSSPRIGAITAFRLGGSRRSIAKDIQISNPLA